jgi:MurNAc alpha-1-phosphate uridylyltransferase
MEAEMENGASVMMPETGMVLAAGLGTRMRPITDRMPKPLVPVAGRALVDYAIDRLEEAGVRRIVVNAHYKADMLAAHLHKRDSAAEIEISDEDDLLETGGGVLKALPRLGDLFYVVNSDVIWLDGKVSALKRLARFWDDATMDVVLLLQRTTTAVGYDGIGDFFLDPDAVPRRRGEREIAPYLFAGVQLMHRRVFAGIGERRFSLNRIYDRALEAGRLRAVLHDGEWYHVGTPEGLALTEDLLHYHRTER